MKFQFAFVGLTLCLAWSSAGSFAPQTGTKKAAAFSFGNVGYFHRFTKESQHEYTPDGQEDLNAWTDMVTINLYPKANDGDALAAAANAVLGNYKTNGGSVMKTSSVPRTKNKPAEHFIAVVFARPTFMEAAFARFRMHGGTGSAVIYSRRVYGNKAREEIGAWLVKNGAQVEKNLMTWNAMPKLPASK